MQRRTWSPAPAIVVTAWLAAAAALAWSLFTGEAGGRLLAGVAAAGLGAAALVGTLARPRLAADPAGVSVRGPGGTHHWPWPAVSRVAVVTTRRLGRRVAVLELDATATDGTEHLVVLGRLDLGADVEDVAADLRALRPG